MSEIFSQVIFSFQSSYIQRNDVRISFSQVKKEPIDLTDTVKQQENYDGTKTNRPVILRKPDLQRPSTGEKLPTAKVIIASKNYGKPHNLPYT